MEYSEIEKLWNNYDDKLNELTTINKLALTKTIAQSSQKKINRFQFQNYYGVILVPAILILVFYPNLFPFIPNPKLIVGTLLMLAVVCYSSWHFIYGIILLNKVDVVKDSVVESVNKINRYNQTGINRIKAQLITGPMLFASIILIGWDGFTFNLTFFLFMAVLILASFLLAKRHLRQHTQRIEKLLYDVEELKYYKD